MWAYTTPLPSIAMNATSPNVSISPSISQKQIHFEETPIVVIPTPGTMLCPQLCMLPDSYWCSTVHFVLNSQNFLIPLSRRTRNSAIKYLLSRSLMMILTSPIRSGSSSRKWKFLLPPVRDSRPWYQIWYQSHYFQDKRHYPFQGGSWDGDQWASNLTYTLFQIYLKKVVEVNFLLTEASSANFNFISN